MRDREREAIHRKVADDTIEYLINIVDPNPSPTPLSLELMGIRQAIRKKEITGIDGIKKALSLSIPTPAPLPSEPLPEWESDGGRI